MTRSHGTARAWRLRRYASRSSRLMRFRRTAFPCRLPTHNPSRGWPSPFGRARTHDLAKLKGAPFLKNAVEFPFQPHVLERSKPVVRFHSNVLHCAAELLGRPEHYSISFTACHGQAAPEAVREERRFTQAHSAGLTGKCIFLLRLSLHRASRSAGLEAWNRRCKLQPPLQVMAALLIELRAGATALALQSARVKIPAPREKISERARENGCD